MILVQTNEGKAGPMITADDVQKAFERLAGRVLRTPLFTSRSLSELSGTDVLLKAECLQRTGSFKIRGALNSALAGRERGDRSDLIAISSGNHAMAVAMAAREASLHATLVMLERGPPLKRAATIAYGAEVVWQGVEIENREEIGDTIHDKRGLRWIHPFEDGDLIAGHGTLGIELVEQAAEMGRRLDAVLVPVGGGALIAGVATSLRALSPETRVVGVEPAIADDASRSLASGTRVEFDSQPHTVADAVNHIHVGETAWSLIRETVDEIVTVEEEDILVATWLLWTRAKLLAEPAGALGLAPLLSGRLVRSLGGTEVGWGGQGRRALVACVLSGGNVDPLALTSQLANARTRERRRSDGGERLLGRSEGFAVSDRRPHHTDDLR